MQNLTSSPVFVIHNNAYLNNLLLQTSHLIKKKCGSCCCFISYLLIIFFFIFIIFAVRNLADSLIAMQLAIFAVRASLFTAIFCLLGFLSMSFVNAAILKP